MQDVMPGTTDYLEILLILNDYYYNMKYEKDG